MQNSLQEKVILITGAGRRIGMQIARDLHAEGMRVAIHYHESEKGAKQLCAELNEKRADSAMILKADLLHHESTDWLVQETVAKWGRLDGLVNNASRYYRTHMGSVTETAWDDLMISNVKAPFFLSQAAAPYLAKHQGVIVNITDIHAESPMRDYPVYCISKSGLQMMTKVLAKELAPAVRVNGVAPGPVLWPEDENALSEDVKQNIINRTLLKRVGNAKDVSKAVLFFIRDACYVTGQILNVDGGRSAR